MSTGTCDAPGGLLRLRFEHLAEAAVPVDSIVAKEPKPAGQRPTWPAAFCRMSCSRLACVLTLLSTLRPAWRPTMCSGAPARRAVRMKPLRRLVKDQSPLNPAAEQS